MSPPIAAYVEVGGKRTFAGAVEWPGWCRAGRDEAEALERLVAYGPRYALVLGSAKRPARPPLRFAPPSTPSGLQVVERLAGNATTDFGAPGIALAADERPLDAAELARLTGILEACWAALDRAVVGATGVRLSTGPRGGGRDLAKIVDHVVEAEASYLSVLGSRPPKRVSGAGSDGPTGAAAQLRSAELETLAAVTEGRPAPNARGGTKRWLPRYFVRRTAWHALDHAWEIEDRAAIGHGASR